MHLLGGTENGIDRTGLNALGAANALVFTDKGNSGYGFFGAVFGVQRLRFYAEQIGQRLNRPFAAGRAFIDLFTAGNGFGVGLTTRIAALTTLGLRQQVVDLIDNRVAFYFKADGGKTQNGTKNNRQNGQQADRNNNGPECS